MFRQKHSLAAAIAALSSVLLLLLTACGSASNSAGTSTDFGDPVAGGQGQFIQLSEPRTLDPAGLGNVWATQPTLGNALYGTLMINTPGTLDIEYKMAEDFSSTDNGSTFTLKLRPGLQFSDGTPLDAEAVRYNWDRLRDPTLGSGASKFAPQISSLEVIDPTTLQVTMVAPNLHFDQAVITSALNWIASPAALEKGRASFDAAPVGAGPFTLVSWSRQDEIRLQKNPTYWDAPKPYLDTLIIKSVPDGAQRFNAVTTGATNFSSESDSENLEKAAAAGSQTDLVETGGGQYMAMNVRRAPFDDVRARQAVSLALDTEALNMIVYNGAGDVPTTLFTESSPFYVDVPLRETNQQEAQALFNELAAEGKPVSFDFTAYSTTENRQAAEGVQAQLSAYDNVEVNIKQVDSSEIQKVVGSRDFQMVISSANVLDPDTELWTSFHSQSKGNMTGISDPQLDAALDAGRVESDVAARTEAYKVVQERLAEVVPGVFYIRSTPGAMFGKNIAGVQMYGLGSPLPEEIWLAN